MGLIELGTALSEHLKPVNLGLVVVNFGRDDHCRREMLEENVGQVRSEKASIKVDVAASARQVPIGQIRFLTTRTVNLYSACPYFIGHTKR